MARVLTCTRQPPLYTVFNRLIRQHKRVCVCIDDERRIVATITLGNVFSLFLPERMEQFRRSGTPPTVPEALSYLDKPQTPTSAAAEAKAADASSQAEAANGANSKWPGQPPHRRKSSLLARLPRATPPRTIWLPRRRK